jgi:hypothetical protein
MECILGQGLATKASIEESKRMRSGGRGGRREMGREKRGGTFPKKGGEKAQKGARGGVDEGVRGEGGHGLGKARRREDSNSGATERRQRHIRPAGSSLISTQLHPCFSPVHTALPQMRARHLLYKFYAQCHAARKRSVNVHKIYATPFFFAGARLRVMCRA